MASTSPTRATARIGSYSIIFGSLGNATPFDFVKEVQVKTGGYEAEFGQSMGGVVNVVTKSGIERAARIASSATRGRRRSKASGKTVQTVNGTVNTVEPAGARRSASKSAAASSANKLFFFGAINPSWQTRTFIAPEGFPLESLGEVDRKRSTAVVLGEGRRIRPPRSHRFDASFFGDPSKGDMGPQRTSSLIVDDTSSFSELDYGGHNQTVRYDGVLSSQLLLEAIVRARVQHDLESCRRSTSGASRIRPCRRSASAAVSVATKPATRARTISTRRRRRTSTVITR